MSLVTILLPWIVFLPYLIIATSPGGLTISQPLSDQFIPVARINQNFQFTFSESTFSTSSNGNSLSYTAFNLPPWLSFSGSTRTFDGLPTNENSDLGLRLVQITATTLDGQSSISDHLPLYVSDHQSNLSLQYPLKDQLSTKNTNTKISTITSAYPFSEESIHYPGVRVPPNWSFSLGFTPSTFQSPTHSRIFYSASLKNGQPLPNWLSFNNQTVTFDGVTPQQLQSSSSNSPNNDDGKDIYEIILYGSDIYGYSDIQESFTIIISLHELQLVKPLILNMTLGYSGEIGLKNLLKSSLTLDDKGEQGINISDLTDIKLDTNSLNWLSFDPTNISISGISPINQQNTDLPLSVMDKYGDILNTTVKLAFYPSIFRSDKPESVTIDMGKLNTISLNQFFSNAGSTSSNINMTTTFDPKEAGSWLSLSPDQKSLIGTPPDHVKYDSIAVTLKAQDLNTNAYSRIVLNLSLFSNTTTTTVHQHPHQHSGNLSKGTKVAISIVCSLVGILLSIFLLIQLRRKRSSNRGGIENEEYNPRTHSPNMEEGKWSYEAAETPALEYVEKMGGDPATTQMLILGRIDGGSSETVVGGGHGGTPTGPTIVPHTRSTSHNSNTTKRSFLSNPFRKGNKRILPKISNPIIMPSLSNAAFQAQLANAVDKAGIVNREGIDSTYSDFDNNSNNNGGDFSATPSYLNGIEIDRSQNSSKLSQRSDMTGGSGISNTSSMLDRSTTLTEDSSKFIGGGGGGGGNSSLASSIGGRTGTFQSSRASWESEPPFIWTTGDTPATNHNNSGSFSINSNSRRSSNTSNRTSTMTFDPNQPTQRSDFKITNIPIASSSSSSSNRKLQQQQYTINRSESPIGSINSENEGISIDNIHFPTDSDIAHTEVSSSLSGEGDFLENDPNQGVIIQTASRIDARRTLDSPAATASLASTYYNNSNNTPSTIRNNNNNIGGGGATPVIASPVMTTHSRLVSFGKQKKVEVEQYHSGNNRSSISHSAVIEAASIGLGISTTTTQSQQQQMQRTFTPSPPPESPLPQIPIKAVTSKTKISASNMMINSIAVTGRSPKTSGSSSIVPPNSLPSLPALPTLPSTKSTSSTLSKKSKSKIHQPNTQSDLTTNSSSSMTNKSISSPSPINLDNPQKILLGVLEPFHFYPPLSLSLNSKNQIQNQSLNSISTSKNSFMSRDDQGIEIEYFAYVEKRLPSLKSEKKNGGSIITKLIDLPDWLHFEDGELWGVPKQNDRGEIDIRIIERRLSNNGNGEDKIVGRFSLEVSFGSIS
ncbi:uncharacterized protein L201_006095 [Kwoniella dendrophila CBS 6074]|uniref:Dystroglycan-type cadherin-like domain-containing protein n=1 Tax=Kwoniella dendrophila CBS 6074 TaxID=1295534 RepID=A0AAX4K198_9TREE